MLPLEYAPRWRIAGILLLLAVLVATLTPASWLWPGKIELVSWIKSFDKWAHLFTFVILTVWFTGQYRPRSYWRIAAGLMVFGMLIEVCQRIVGYRSADWLDLAADVAGILAGLAIAISGAGGWSLRVEAWICNRKT